MMADRKKVEPLLRTARGQIDGVLKMIEDNRYCMDIMMQLQAVESLVHKAVSVSVRWRSGRSKASVPPTSCKRF